MRLAALEHFLVVIFVHDCSLFLLLLLLLLLMVLLLLLQQHSTYVSLIKSQARGCSTKMSQLWNVLPFVIIIFHNAPQLSSPSPLTLRLSPVSCSGHVNSKIMIHYAGVPSIVVTSSKSQRRDEKEDHKKEKPKEKGHGDNTQKAENGCGWRCSHASSLS